MIVRCKCDQEIFIIHTTNQTLNKRKVIHQKPITNVCCSYDSIVFVAVFKAMSQFIARLCIACPKYLLCWNIKLKATITPRMRCTQEIRVDTMSKINLLLSSGVHSTNCIIIVFLLGVSSIANIYNFFGDSCPSFNVQNVINIAMHCNTQSYRFFFYQILCSLFAVLWQAASVLFRIGSEQLSLALVCHTSFGNNNKCPRNSFAL